jgi:hypothetical protein
VTTMYATVADLKTALSSTDSGVGTAAQLSDPQLTQALVAASNRVSAYSGTTYDADAIPPQVAPAIYKDLTLQLAAYWATRNYLKHIVIGPTHPVFLGYTEAMTILDLARRGQVTLDPSPSGTSASGVHNRIPAIFAPADSNTYTDADGYLKTDTPADLYAPSMRGWGAGWEAQY